MKGNIKLVLLDSLAKNWEWPQPAHYRVPPRGGYKCLFPFHPLHDKEERKVNELESVHLNRQCQDVLPSPPLTRPTSAQVICAKSSFISMEAPCKEGEARRRELWPLCRFSSWIKINPAGVRRSLPGGKRRLLFKVQRKRVYQGGNPRRNLGGRNAVPVERASLFSLQNVDNREISG